MAFPQIKAPLWVDGVASRFPCGIHVGRALLVNRFGGFLGAEPLANHTVRGQDK